MREQAIVHKVGNRSGISGQRRSGASVQKPQRRDTGGAGIGSRLRSLLNYFPAVLKLIVAVVIATIAFASYHAAASATFFQVRSVEVQGTSRVDRGEVQTVVKQQVEKTGVWNADLKALTARLEHLPWVHTAVVSRVLPDGIRVRISERVPRVVVRTAAGRFRWADDEAVLLGEMLPTDQIPPFFLRGLSEEESDTARSDNRDRVQKFLELQRDWDAAGLSERVSEVNVFDVGDVRAQLAGDSSQIEVRLGAHDQSTRLKEALEVLDAQRQTPRGAMISYIDMNQGKRAIVGLSSGVHTVDDQSEPASLPAETVAEKKTTSDTPKATIDRRAPESKNKKDTHDTARDKKTDKPKETARRKA